MHFKSAGLDSRALEDRQKLEHNPTLHGFSWSMPAAQEGQGFRACPSGQPVPPHAWAREPGRHAGLHTSGLALKNKEVQCLTCAGLPLHRICPQMCLVWGICIMCQKYLFIKKNQCFPYSYLRIVCQETKISFISVHSVQQVFPL